MNALVPLTVGGGIRSVDDMKMFLSVGADKISVNSSAIKDPKIITQGALKFGNQCIVVAIDAKKMETLGKFLLMEEESKLELM